MKRETKHDRFKRVGKKRVQRVIDSLRGLSHLSNRRMYEWNDENLRKIWNAIEEELKKCKSSFDNSDQEDFKF